MNYLIWTGLSLGALGSYIIYLGGKKDSDNAQREISDKLDTFNAQLSDVINGKISDDDKQQKGFEIENDFDAWAKELNNDYSEKELNHKMKSIQEAQKKIHINKEWINTFSRIFNNIDRMGTALNNELKDKKIEIFKSEKKFPRDLFSEETELYYIIWKFDTAFSLKVNIKIDDAEIPILVFNIFNELKEAKEHNYSHENGLEIEFNPNKEYFTVSFTRDFFGLRDYSDTDSIALNELDDYIKKVFRNAFLSCQQ